MISASSSLAYFYRALIKVNFSAALWVFIRVGSTWGAGEGPARQMQDLRALGLGPVLSSNLVVSSVLPSLREGSPCFRQGIGQKERGWL